MKSPSRGINLGIFSVVKRDDIPARTSFFSNRDRERELSYDLEKSNLTFYDVSFLIQ